MADRDPRFPWLADNMLRESEARVRTAEAITPEDHPAYEKLGQILTLISDARNDWRDEL